MKSLSVALPSQVSLLEYVSDAMGNNRQVGMIDSDLNELSPLVILD
jgi:hypothetical protein